jgi:hypothetical protein
MVDVFRAKFAVMIDTINLVDLANVKPNPDEKMSEYIARWRNLSVKCDHKLTQEEAVEFILRNISKEMRLYLSVALIRTYHDLIKSVARLEKTLYPKTEDDALASRPQKSGKVNTRVAYIPNRNKGVANTNTTNNTSMNNDGGNK